jgi:SSS family solute:Na+ symporter
MGALDWVVLAGYLIATTFYGCLFLRKNKDSAAFMAAGRSLPGWAVGLSLFGSYVSSISFLANPGKSYDSNWNPFVFALSLPLACWLAAQFFVPLYRVGEQISAYERFEKRFGRWARVYATLCFLLVQVARLGTILYLLSLALQPLVGSLPLPVLILLLGLLVTIYPMLGGTEAVIWTGVVQAVVMIIGPLVCVGVILAGVPGGFGAVVSQASTAGKFSLGSLAPDFASSSFWVVLLYGMAINLQNFGVDQAYVQRYLTAKADRDATRSVWLGGLLYVPIAALFFFIGTALWAFYQAHASALPPSTKPDAVFPWFIQTQLPVGLKGLVLAAVCAAAMDSNLNCSATLFVHDLWAKRESATEAQKLTMLRLAVVGFGLLSILAAIAMISVKTALDVWWDLAGVLSGGMLGLFLLDRLVPKASKAAALPATIVGALVSIWVSFSQKPYWPASLPKAPLHSLLTLTVGTLTIVVLGVLLSQKKQPEG